MKRLLLICFAACLAFGAFTVSASPSAQEIFNDFTVPAASFSDMDGFSWAEEAVDYLTSNGIISGVGGNLFMPSRKVTRIEFIKMVCAACSILDEDSESEYTDVTKEHWGYIYASSAKKIGLLDIYEDDFLGADTPVSREDMAYIAAKAIGFKKYESDELFSDDSTIAAYAKEAVYFLREKGIINGRGQNIFAPKENAMRAEAAKIIYSTALEFNRNYFDN